MKETEDGLRHLLKELAHVEPALPQVRVTVGDQLGRYRLLRELGRGGFGVVFAAKDPELGREVAVKVMRNRGEADGRLREQFHREASIVAQLRHPQIVTIYDWSRTGDTPYLVMELLHGETLEERLRRGPLRFDEGLDLCLAVAGALATAHQSDAVHRDLKPSNVFLCQDGVAKVLDFGLAQKAGGETLLEGAGTPHYMAPEQRQEGKSSPASDVWSFGLVLYEIFLGKRAEDPAQAPAELPPALRQIAARLLAPTPEARLADGNALLVELTRIRAELREKTLRRRRLRTLALAGALSLVALAVVVVTMQRSSAARVSAAAEAAAGVGRIESQLRYAHMAPEHDLSADEARARADLERLQAKLVGMGGFARGRAEYALGRGLLALGDADAAIEHLRRARQAEDPPPEAQEALGEALGASWERRRRELDALRDPATRQARKEQLERELLKPAIQLLESGRSSSQLALARLALWNDRAEEARQLAARAQAEAPYLYEAALVVSRTYEDAAHTAFFAGKFADAEQSLERAEEAAAPALAMGRSDPEAHEQSCARAVLRFDLVNTRGTVDAETARRAHEQCDRAAAVSPRRLSTLARVVELRLLEAEASHGDLPKRQGFYAEADALVARALAVDPKGDQPLELSLLVSSDRLMRLQNLGENPPPELIARSIRDGEALMARRGDEANAMRLADLLFTQAQADIDRGGDPTETISKMEKLLAGARRAESISRLGRALLVFAEWQMAHGIDPDATLQRATTRYEAAIALQSGRPGLYDQLSGVYYDRGLNAELIGQDGSPAFRRAVELGEHSLQLRPDSPTSLANQGMTLADFADSERKHHRDPTALLTRAVEVLDRSVRIEPKAPNSWYNLALAHRVWSEWLVDRGKEPAPELAAGRAAAKRAIASSPDTEPLRILESDLDRVEARWELLHGRSPLALLQHAEPVLQRLLAADPSNSSLRLSMANLLMMRIDWQAAHHLPLSDVAAGRAVLAPLLAGKRPQPDARELDAKLAALQR